MLTLDQVTRGYQSRRVLEGATLHLAPGRVTCLIGGNGAGKTTLLRVAVGLLDPQEGRVSLAGLDPVRDRLAYQRRLGYVPAGNGGLYARLTVKQQLALWSDIAFVPRRERATAVARSIETMQLAELSSSRVDRLSTGQRQRVRLALGFLHGPDVVLLDEPHASLDDAGLHSLATAVEGVLGRGGSVLWCAPKRSGIDVRVDDAYELRDGRVWPA